MSFWSDVVDTITQMVAGNAAGVSAPAGPAVAAATSAPGLGMLTAVEGIWAELTDGKLWRSLGWLVLGIVLMLLGVAWWIGPSGARRSPVGLAAEGLS